VGLAVGVGVAFLHPAKNRSKPARHMIINFEISAKKTRCGAGRTWVERIGLSPLYPTASWISPCFEEGGWEIELSLQWATEDILLDAISTQHVPFY
jgi:hypothetical protein